jgi:hypothetical protein
MPRITVVHTGYGCGTGCCGHVVEVDDLRVGGFDFLHPLKKDWKAFVQDTVTREVGAEHVKDIDWDNCTVEEH